MYVGERSSLRLVSQVLTWNKDNVHSRVCLTIGINTVQHYIVWNVTETSDSADTWWAIYGDLTQATFFSHQNFYSTNSWVGDKGFPVLMYLTLNSIIMSELTLVKALEPNSFQDGYLLVIISVDIMETCSKSSLSISKWTFRLLYKNIFWLVLAWTPASIC